jgi:hypothetical protein
MILAHTERKVKRITKFKIKNTTRGTKYPRVTTLEISKQFLLVISKQKSSLKNLFSSKRFGEGV